MKIWVLYRKRTHKEQEEAIKNATYTIDGEIFIPRVDPYIDVIKSEDFLEITKYIEEHHEEYNQWKLSAVEIGCRTCAEEEFDRKLLNESVGYIGEYARKARHDMGDKAWEKWKNEQVERINNKYRRGE